MHKQPIWIVMAGVVILVAAILVGSRFLTSSAPALQETPVAHFGAENGALSDALISPDNVTLRILEVQKSGTLWRFHVHAHNNSAKGVSVLESTTDRYFMLGGRGQKGTPYTADQVFLKLKPPTDLTAGPSLPAVTSANGDSDGWLVADLTNFKLQPYQLLYVYGTVKSLACPSPVENDSCKPSVAYRTLVWQL